MKQKSSLKKISKYKVRNFEDCPFKEQLEILNMYIFSVYSGNSILLKEKADNRPFWAGLHLNALLTEIFQKNEITITPKLLKTISKLRDNYSLKYNHYTSRSINSYCSHIAETVQND